MTIAEYEWVLARLRAAAQTGTNGAVLPLLLPTTRTLLLRAGFDYAIASRCMWVFWDENAWMRL
jgi:hypothetical protein